MARPDGSSWEVIICMLAFGFVLPNSRHPLDSIFSQAGLTLTYGRRCGRCKRCHQKAILALQYQVTSLMSNLQVLGRCHCKAQESPSPWPKETISVVGRLSCPLQFPFSTLRNVCGKHAHHDHDASTDTRSSWLPFRTVHCHFQNAEESLEPATTANLANAGAMAKSLVRTVQSTGRYAPTMHPILVADRINSRLLPQYRRVHSRQAQGEFLVGGRTL
jgi:hypothetical protein